MSLLDKTGLQELWGKIKNYVSSTTYSKTALDIKFKGRKYTQTAVSDPTASGTGVEFISGISQDAQGVISPSKKTVRTMGSASADAAGSTGLVPAPAKGDQGKFLNGAGQWQTPTNTKNTAGSTDSSSKLFLIGATSQAASPQTYSHDTAYVGTDGCLYSGGKKVLTDHQDVSDKVPTTRKVNNKALSADITLNDEDIPSTVDGKGNVEAVLSYHSQQITNLQNGLATPSITGSTNNTGDTITAGTYFRLNDVLCIAIADIANNATFTVNTNYRTVSEGGLNALGSVINYTTSVTASGNATISNIKAHKCGRIAIISFLVNITATSSTWTSVLNIPDMMMPYTEYYAFAINDNNSSAVEARVSFSSVDIWRPVVGNIYFGSIVYLTSK